MKRWILACAALALPAAALAQEVEPRRWGHLPSGASFAAAAYARTEADVLFDPVLEIEDVDLEIDNLAFSYIRSFALAGKSARVDLLTAYQQAEWTGLLRGEPARAYRSGWSDPVVRLTVLLMGAPPLKGREFAQYRAQQDRETIVGVGLAVSLPLGDYLDDKLLNLGKNRFHFRPHAGVVHTRGKWAYEATASYLHFTDNDDFFGGSRLEQERMHALQGHVVHTFRPGLWVSVGGAWLAGGRSTIDGERKDDRKEDVFWGASLGYPITRRVGIKAAYIGTRTQVDVGADSDTLTVAVSGLW